MRVLLIALPLLAGCQVNLPTFTEDDALLDADTSIDMSLVDGPPPDAMPCVADTIVCNDDTSHYVDCGPSEQCVEIDPSNGLAAYLDMARTAPDVHFEGSSTLAADQVFNGPTSIEVPSEMVDGVRVYMFRTLTVSGTLKALTDSSSEQPPIAIVVYGDLIIDGTLDVSADMLAPGPGGRQAYDVDAGIACNGSSYVGPSGPTPGAKGAGGAAMGAIGGNAGNGTMPTSGGGASHFEANLEPLVGGCAGGMVVESGAGPQGGGGGGAVQLVSRTRIVVMGSGKLDASGGGGGGGFGAAGGAGGGSGGAILMEAPQIILDGPGVVLSTKGGSGGSSGNASGSDGGTSAGATPGGTSPPNPAGGSGGVNNTAPVAGQNGSTSTMDGAGGGGSGGRALLRNVATAVNPQNGAVILSTLQTSYLETRLVP